MDQDTTDMIGLSKKEEDWEEGEGATDIPITFTNDGKITHMQLDGKITQKQLKEAIELAEYLRDIKYQPEQVQDFYPTPGTLSTTMFYTGLDPLTMKPVYVPKSKHEKAMQRALLQYTRKQNYDLVRQALIKANRKDLK